MKIFLFHIGGVIYSHEKSITRYSKLERFTQENRQETLSFFKVFVRKLFKNRDYYSCLGEPFSL